MDFFDFESTIDSNTSVTCRYICLDTIEGASCFGHWMIEAALFLPYLSSLKEHSPVPIKILLQEPKKYKSIVLKEFGIFDKDICYSTKTRHMGGDWQRVHVLPSEDNYEIYIPHFTFCWESTPSSVNYFKHIEAFRKHFIKEDIHKDIDVLYLKRSSKENYKHNFRHFINFEEVVQMLTNEGCQILDIDTLNDLQSQINLVRRAKILIIEQGSATTINAGWFAENSQIILLNDYVNFQNYNLPYAQVLRLQFKQRNNICLRYPTNHMDPRTPFSVDITILKELLDKARQHSQKESLIRKSCVICNSREFDLINTFKNFPIMAICNNDVIDTYYDKIIGMCKNCNCIQLMNLVDPNILYSSLYTHSIFSPSWEHHNNFLSNFILNTTDESDFIEIGANTGVLYKLMKQQRSINYSVLDIFRHKDLPEEINFFKGYCETFNYTGHRTVILSHVFEHLYEPSTLISKLKSAGVLNVYIAVPNFDKLLSTSSLEILNSQHIYFCGKEHMDYLFSKYGYKSQVSYIYDHNIKSIMVKYILSDSLPLQIPSINKLQVDNIYINKVNRLKNIKLPSNTYIMPSGLYGQYLYYFLTENEKSKVVGFLDNNEARSGKRLFGTDKLVYTPQTFDLSTINILLCDCPYIDEIKEGLLKLNKDVSIIYEDTPSTS
jgi:hypothetical protein